jgi:hypothetical protein
MKSIMTKKISIILILFIISNCSAQDTNIVKYLPLQIGNLWVYSYVGIGGNGNGKIKITITGTQVANGHVYYIFNQTGNTCTCASYTYSPFLDSLKPLRIDSVSGNVMFYGNSCQWHINETLLDSLKTRVGDNYLNSCNQTLCADTNQQNVFGILRKTKYVGLPINNYSKLRRYAKDIGLIASYQGCYFSSSCNYTLTGCIINGVLYGDTSLPLGINQISTEIPKSFALFQNYPNPFNPGTKIKFAIPTPLNPPEGGTLVRIVIYDALGREITTLVDEQLNPGTYEVEWDAGNFPSGVYFYKLETGEFSETKKLILLK